MVITQNFNRILIYAQEEAERLQCPNVEPEHLLLAIIRLGEGSAYELLCQTDFNPAEAKKQLDDFGQANFSVGGAMKQTTSMLVASASKFVGWGAAVSGALKVAKDAFLTSETNVDDWGRTIASAKGVYEGFVQSLNNGDISGFLNNE